MATRQEIDEFTRFALEQIDDGGAELSVEELLDLWRCRHADPAEFAENVAAVKAASDDYRNGDRGEPAGELSRDLRNEIQSAVRE